MKPIRITKTFSDVTKANKWLNDMRAEYNVRSHGTGKSGTKFVAFIQHEGKRTKSITFSKVTKTQKKSSGQLLADAEKKLNSKIKKTKKVSSDEKPKREKVTVCSVCGKKYYKESGHCRSLRVEKKEGKIVVSAKQDWMPRIKSNVQKQILAIIGKQKTGTVLLCEYRRPCRERLTINLRNQSRVANGK